MSACCGRSFLVLTRPGAFLFSACTTNQCNKVHYIKYDVHDISYIAVYNEYSHEYNVGYNQNN